MATQLLSAFKMFSLSLFFSHKPRKPHSAFHQKQILNREQAKMAKTSLFKAYDLQRKKTHTLPSPPTKIHQHRVDKREWTAQYRKGSRRSPRRKAAVRAKEVDPTAANILRYIDAEWPCLHCEKGGNDVDCSEQCYLNFRKENLHSDDLIDIRGPGSLGYAAYTKPGTTIKRNEWLGEYLGDLRPCDIETESRYCFIIPDICIIDAEKAGNWTRFVNSNCRPNVQAWSVVVGKRCVMLFKAKRRIGPEEELTINHGCSFFKRAGFSCRCSSCVPSKVKKKSRR